MNTKQLADIWDCVLKEMQPTVSPIIYSTWFKTAIPLRMDETNFEIGVPKQFVQEWLELNYKASLQEKINSITKQNLTLKVINLNISEEDQPQATSPEEYQPEQQPTNNTYNSTQTSRTELQFSPTLERSDKKQPSSATKTQNSETGNLFAQNFSEDLDSNLNPKYIFENFVTGSSNRFAHAAALAVAENPGRVYNPLFLYGGVGLGKTHLMHAIGNKIKKNNPGLKVLYISSEKFTNELINSIRDGNPEAFRQKYRNIDCLLVDDIQFLSKKEHTQEEFFHTFNTLHEANKHIIISSDRQPKEIPTLEDRLRSRFEWGLITDVQAPDLETRIAILRKKALLEQIDIPNDIMLLIASRIDNNIRELEGALIRVMAYSSIHKEPITMELAQSALKDIFPENIKKPVTIEKIQEMVSDFYKIKLEDFMAKKRTRQIAYPRQIAMYLCRELTNASLPRIGEMFGGRDHTTVIHAHDKIAQERLQDLKLDSNLKDLITRIQS